MVKFASKECDLPKYYVDSPGQRVMFWNVQTVRTLKFQNNFIVSGAFITPKQETWIFQVSFLTRYTAYQRSTAA
jgi:hypothetical protein